jgi:hypothetical protein
MALASPIPLPNIQLKVFQPDVQKYLPNRLARIRAIGERARQDKLRKEAYQNALAKEFRDIDIEKQKLSTDYWNEEQEKLINGFLDWSATRQAQEDKAFTGAELAAARKYANDVSHKLDRMALSEEQYKKDSKFIEDNLADIDPEFKLAYDNYDPKRGALYTDYLKYHDLKPALRTYDTTEVAEQMFDNYLAKDKVNEFVNLYEDTHGNEVKDITKFLGKYYNVDEAGKPVSPNQKEQFDFLQSAMGRDVRWQNGTMKEFDALDDEKKQFYSDLAEGIPVSSRRGYYSERDITVDPTLSKKDAYLYYLYDKEADNIFKGNRYITVKEKELVDKKKPDVKNKGGWRVVDGRYDVSSVKPTSFPYDNGLKTNNYYQLGVNEFKNLSSVIVSPVDVSGEGVNYGETMTSDDFKNYDIIGLDFSTPEDPMLHYNVYVGDEAVMRNGKPVYNRFGYSGTEEEIMADIKARRKDDKKGAKEEIKNVKQWIGNGTLTPVMERKTKDILAPINSNPTYANQFIIPRDISERGIKVKETEKEKIEW